MRTIHVLIAASLILSCARQSKTTSGSRNDVSNFQIDGSLTGKASDQKISFQECIDRLKKTPVPPSSKTPPSIWSLIGEHGDNAGQDGCFMREQIVNLAAKRYCPDLDGKPIQVWSIFPEDCKGWTYHTVPACLQRDGKVYVCETNSEGKVVCMEDWGYCRVLDRPGKVIPSEAPDFTQPPTGEPANIYWCDSKYQSGLLGPMPSKAPTLEALCKRSNDWTECIKKCNADFPRKDDEFESCVDGCYRYLRVTRSRPPASSTPVPATGLRR